MRIALPGIRTGKQYPRESAFTLLELMSVIMIIALLVILTVPALEQVRERVERINCTANLRSLYVGASAYVQAHGSWPQIDPHLMAAKDHSYDEGWIEALQPYGIERSTWICPTVQHLLAGPDYTQKANYRTDYIAMPFDQKTLTPSKWPTQPWFAERANVHGNGNLLIQANGSVTDLNSIASPVQLPATQ